MASSEARKGTRCDVCVMCGRCFENNTDVGASEKWSGTRCDVCVSCGKCAEAWGLVGNTDTDAITGPTSWADAFKVMDTGSAGAPPPVIGAPGVPSFKSKDGERPLSQPTKTKPSNFACLRRGADGEKVDTTTGATPGVSSACKEHGFDDMEKLISDLGIKPPGVA